MKQNKSYKEGYIQVLNDLRNRIRTDRYGSDDWEDALDHVRDIMDDLEEGLDEGVDYNQHN